MEQRERQKAKNLPLSDRCREVILGSLLGDGSLKKHKGYKNARFSFRHSVKQKEYFDWKVSEMKEVSSNNCWWLQNHDGWSSNKKLRYQSLAIPSLTQIYDLVHRHGKFRVRRKWLNLLTPISLCVWWLDDGSIIGSGRQGVFCSEGFSREENLILSKYLRVVWGVQTKMSEKKKGSGKYRLWIYSSENMKKFLRIILPHISTESMLYKAILLYKDSLFQQRWISEITKLTSFEKEVVENHIQKKKKKWKNFRE